MLQRSFTQLPRYNAMTGGLDVLYSGVPAVTLPGEDFSSRVLAALPVFPGAGTTVARTISEYERLAEVLMCASMQANYQVHGESSSNISSSAPSCRVSASQKTAAHHLLSHLDSQRHMGTLFNTQAWVACMEAAMRMTVDLRTLLPGRMPHIVVARHVCALVA